jgi:hypothetical protein
VKTNQSKQKKLNQKYLKTNALSALFVQEKNIKVFSLKQVQERIKLREIFDPNLNNFNLNHHPFTLNESKKRKKVIQRFTKKNVVLFKIPQHLSL